MGGAVDSGVGLDNKTSPRRAAIEKAQAELRLEFDVREERRRELEFLEKGGNPLDFKLGPATSISLHSNSLTNQLAEQHLISDVKGSFALTTSPHGDSVESSGRPGNLLLNDPNSADNLLLFNNDHDILNGGRNTIRGHVAPSEQSSQLDVTDNIKEADDSLTLRLGAKSQAYARRIKPRSSHECAQASFSHDPQDVKAYVRDVPTDKDHAVSFICNSKPTSPNCNVVSETRASFNQSEMELDTVQAHENATELTKVGYPEGKSDTMNLEKSHGNEVNRYSQFSEQDPKTDRACDPKDLDSESSRPQISHNLNGTEKEQALVFEKAPLVVPDANGVKESTNSDVQVKIEEEISDSRSDFQCGLRPINGVEETKSNDHLLSGSEGKLDKLLSSSIPSNCEPSEVAFSGRECLTAVTPLENKLHEDVILEEAQTVEASLNRDSKLSVSNSLPDKRGKSHWDFVLEEMAWLANDFMQERVWKIAAAAHIIRCVAFTGRIKFDNENLCQKQRKMACTWANAIMQFWRSAEEIMNCDDPSDGLHVGCNSSFLGSRKVDGGEDVKDRIEESKFTQESTNSMKAECTNRSAQVPLLGYAVRFLKYNRSCDLVQAEAPATPDRTADTGILEMSWEDQLSEESLFYRVPPGAVEAYRKSVESHWALNEKFGITTHPEDCHTSSFDPAEEFGARENAYEDDEGEMGISYLPGAFEGSKSSKFAQKKRKNLPKSYISRSYEVKSMLPHGHLSESKFGNQQGILMGKRASSTLNVGSIPTKRVRTAARQRVVNPSSAGATSGVNIVTKTDVSSGDTSSFHDEQSPLHGGSQPRKTTEVDSPGDFGKQLPFDGLEISTRPKKKKKSKNLGYRNSTESGGFVISGKGSLYEQRWQLDSMAQHEQRDHSKRRSENHHFESNGNTGMHGQQAAKKPKLLKQLADTSPETITPVIGSIPSPVASPISSLSNPSKLIKMIANRERSRKNKTVKISAGQLGSGSRWSLFEDQALVVLVHDMGPNWELVSDAISTTLQFKCIFHKPKECKERHKFLMDRDRNAGDGADSAEDSGSSQPYPSTLPGIPKGSAIQLLQRLQGPMEEDTLKSHFEKIIQIGEQRHSHRAQNDDQELKESRQVHPSHALALSQACPNNLNGGLLTPLDLCDTTTSSPDVISCGYQGPHTPTGLSISNHQGSVPPVQPTTANPMLQGSNGMILGNSLPSPSGALNATARDVQRYSVARPTSFPLDEQHRMQQYSQMISGRNMQQSGMSLPGGLPVGNDRGVRMLPGGNGMGMMSGMNRGMTIPRPGFQGMGTPGMLGMVSSGSMLTSTGGGLPSQVSLHSGAVAGQVNSMMRPRETLQMLRPGQNPDDQQRQMMLQELQLQPGNGQGVPPYNNSLTTTFCSNQTIPPPVSFPAQNQMPQQSHMISTPHHSHLQGHNPSPQQQAYLMRVAKERQQLQQRYMQQHQFPSSNPLPPQPHPHHAMSQQQSTQPVSMSPPNLQHSLSSSSSMNHHPISMQNSQKQHINLLPPHASGRGPQTSGALLPNHLLKQQRQRQQQHHQLQQQHRHPSQMQQQQRQMPQSQQQPNKIIKGLGRGGTIMMQQSLPIDSSHTNSGPGSQVGEKAEQVMHLVQGQNLYPGQNPVQPGKQSLIHPGGVSGSQQPKLFSRPPPSSKQPPQLSPLHDNSNQGSQVAAQQPPAAASSSQQQQQQRQSVQSQQTVHRMLQQNRHATSEAPPLLQSSSADQVSLQPINNSHTFQMATSTTTIHPCTDSSPATVAASSAPAVPWKGEPIYDVGPPTSTSELNTMGPTQPNPAGTDSSMPPSSGPQRQYSGGMPIHAHNIGRQWQQQQRHQPPLPQQQPQQQQHQQAEAQGGLYARPANSGPM